MSNAKVDAVFPNRMHVRAKDKVIKYFCRCAPWASPDSVRCITKCVLIWLILIIYKQTFLFATSSFLTAADSLTCNATICWCNFAENYESPAHLTFLINTSHEDHMLTKRSYKPAAFSCRFVYVCLTPFRGQQTLRS